ncbi:MAG: hypothetical protein GKR96_13185 [Gammaproteobacteria bacterium]|nr:hypothetical protein [Gammaproteobacteria bacterium]
MGSSLEVNDTLQLTVEQGFPGEVFNLERHRQNPVTLKSVQDQVFSFQRKPGARLFHLDPVRVFFVEKREGKWLFWGNIVIQSQTIEKQFEADGSWTKGNWMTSGSYRVSKIYDPECQEMFTRYESPPGKGYFA